MTLFILYRFQDNLLKTYPLHLFQNFLKRFEVTNILFLKSSLHFLETLKEFEFFWVFCGGERTSQMQETYYHIIYVLKDFHVTSSQEMDRLHI